MMATSCTTAYPEFLPFEGTCSCVVDVVLCSQFRAISVVLVHCGSILLVLHECPNTYL
jgi:hypothetical protein